MNLKPNIGKSKGKKKSIEHIYLIQLFQPCQIRSFLKRKNKGMPLWIKSIMHAHFNVFKNQNFWVN